jgi:hypothetical protein
MENLLERLAVIELFLGTSNDLTWILMNVQKQTRVK